jgi:hypothetical protein
MKGLTAVQPLAHTAPVQSAEIATEATFKKAEKKRRLREHAAAQPHLPLSKTYPPLLLSF